MNTIKIIMIKTKIIIITTTTIIIIIIIIIIKVLICTFKIHNTYKNK